MIYSIRHTGLFVSNLEKSVHFYGELGFKVHSKGLVEAERVKILYPTLDNSRILYVKLISETLQVLELFCVEGLNSVPIMLGYHIALGVFNIQDTWNWFWNKRLCISSYVIEDNGYKLFFAKDYDGHTIELVETPK